MASKKPPALAGKIRGDELILLAPDGQGGFVSLEKASEIFTIKVMMMAGPKRILAEHRVRVGFQSGEGFTLEQMDGAVEGKVVSE